MPACGFLCGLLGRWQPLGPVVIKPLCAAESRRAPPERMPLTQARSAWALEGGAGPVPSPYPHYSTHTCITQKFDDAWQM